MTWQLSFLKSSQNFWSFDTPDTPGCLSAVFADNQSENEIWNRFKQFLPVWLGSDFVKQLSRIQIQKGRKVLLWNQVKSKMEACYSELVLAGLTRMDPTKMEFPTHTGLMWNSNSSNLEQ